MKVLPKRFYTVPGIAKTTMDIDDIRELLLVTEGCIVANNGCKYSIMCEHIAAEIYKVWLTKDIT